MSGFFMFRRSSLEPLFPHLSGGGFKILLDLLATAPTPLRVRELPFRMRSRLHGESKLDSLVIGEYLLQVAQKIVGDRIPLRFLLFVAVGASGVVVHALVLYLTYRGAGWPFVWGQSLATLVAMTSNFALNNLFTYRDQRLHGSALLRGLLSFYLACSIGAVLNVAVADLLHRGGLPWLGAGLLGAAVGAVWNYALTAHFTWGQRRRPR
jgi:dolichol-phosphate mannosyltransferase